MEPHHGPNRSRTVDVVVVGGGVIGASIARELAVSGASVVLLDQAPGIGGGCSYANAALLAPDHVGPLATPALLRETPAQMIRRPPAVRIRPEPNLAPWLARLLGSATPRRADLARQRLQKLAWDSTRLHCELGRMGLNPTLRKTGALEVYLRRPRKGVPGLLNPDEVDALQPGLASISGGAYDLDEWVVESQSFVRAMLDDAIEHGATVLFDRPVHQLLRQDNRVVGVQTASESIRAGHVVLAAGLHSRGLALRAGLALPLRGGRGYVIDVAAPAGTLTMPVRLKEHRIVITPLPDRVRVCGSIEFGDAARPRKLHHADRLLEVATRVLPALGGLPVIDRWAGDRPCMADGLPAVGPSRRLQNLYVAAGHGMWGLVLAPITARLIQRSLVHRDEGSEHDWLSPDRFTRRKPTGTVTSGRVLSGSR